MSSEKGAGSSSGFLAMRSSIALIDDHSTGSAVSGEAKTEGKAGGGGGGGGSGEMAVRWRGRAVSGWQRGAV